MRGLAAVGAYVRRHHLALLALMVALGGTAYAATLPRKSVGTKQLKTGAVTAKKIAGGAVGSDAVLDNSVGGADIDESTLQGINATTLEGQSISGLASIGRSTPPSGPLCTDDQHEPGGQNCGSVAIDLPRAARLLVIIAGNVNVTILDDVAGPGSGTDDSAKVIGGCFAKVDGDTEVTAGTTLRTAGTSDSIAATGVTGPLEAGAHTLTANCSELDGDVDFGAVTVSAITLSAD